MSEKKKTVKTKLDMGNALFTEYLNKQATISGGSTAHAQYRSVVRVEVVGRKADATDPTRQHDTVRGAGTAFFLANLVGGSGYSLVTCHHVISNYLQIEATLVDGRRFPVEVVCTCPRFDMAILSCDSAPSDLDVIPLAVSTAYVKDIVPGSGVHAVGFPLASKHPIAMSGEYGGFENSMIRHSTGISPGMSGSPLTDGQGRVIGVNSSGFRAMGINSQASPISRLATMVAEYRSKTDAEREQPVVLRDMDSGLEYQAVPTGQGVYVNRVGPTEGELRVGDVILAVNTSEDGYAPVSGHGTIPHPTMGTVTLDTALRNLQNDVSVGMLVRRGSYTVEVEYTPRPTDVPSRMQLYLPWDSVDFCSFLGICVCPLWREHLRHPAVMFWYQRVMGMYNDRALQAPLLLVVKVYPGSRIYNTNTIKENSIISSVNGWNALFPGESVRDHSTAMDRYRRELAKPDVTIEWMGGGGGARPTWRWDARAIDHQENVVNRGHRFYVPDREVVSMRAVAGASAASARRRAGNVRSS